MNFNFPPKKGTGIDKVLPHASPDCVQLIYSMCTYDPDERISAKQALKHPYFKDFRFVNFSIYQSGLSASLPTNRSISQSIYQKVRSIS